MNEHLQFPILTEVEIGGFVSTTCIAVQQVAYAKHHRLLVEFLQVGGSKIYFALDAGRDNVGNWLPATIFFDIYRKDIKSSFTLDVVGHIFAWRK